MAVRIWLVLGPGNLSREAVSQPIERRFAGRAEVTVEAVGSAEEAARAIERAAGQSEALILALGTLAEHPRLWQAIRAYPGWKVAADPDNPWAKGLAAETSWRSLTDACLAGFGLASLVMAVGGTVGRFERREGA